MRKKTNSIIDLTQQDIEAALHDLCAFLEEYAGGTSTWSLLDAHHPAFVACEEMQATVSKEERIL